jgi:hypothetical protein
MGWMMSKTWRWIGVAWLVWAGCAQVELESKEGEGQRCQSPQECAAGMRCDPLLGRCVEVAEQGRDLGADQGEDQGRDQGADLVVAPDLAQEMGAEQGEEPADQGRDLDEDLGQDQGMSCMPACAAGQRCEGGRCVWPACQRAGDRCDEGVARQGSFYCEGAAGQGRCYPLCMVEGSAQGCDAGQRCERRGDGTLACQAAQCVSDAGCGGGTCVAYENGYARCEAAGQAAVGQACDVRQMSARCVQGALCVDAAGRAVSGAGTCRAKCDLWGQISGCGGPSACVPATTRQGVCAPVARDGLGDMVSEPCMTPGAWCADGTVCVDGRAQDVCARLCRPERGAQDCRTHVSDVSQCNVYYFPGDRVMGGCDLDCSMSPAVCGSQAVCQGGVCRRRCQAATVAQDCCAGVRPCLWRCVNDLCE